MGKLIDKVLRMNEVKTKKQADIYSPGFYVVSLQFQSELPQPDLVEFIVQ